MNRSRFGRERKRQQRNLYVVTRQSIYDDDDDAATTYEDGVDLISCRHRRRQRPGASGRRRQVGRPTLRPEDARCAGLGGPPNTNQQQRQQQQRLRNAGRKSSSRDMANDPNSSEIYSSHLSPNTLFTYTPCLQKSMSKFF